MIIIIITVCGLNTFEFLQFGLTISPHSNASPLPKIILTEWLKWLDRGIYVRTHFYINKLNIHINPYLTHVVLYPVGFFETVDMVFA